MTSKHNAETLDALKREIKTLQNNCLNVCNIIENAPPETPSTNQDEISDKCLSYIQALKTEIENPNTIITTDENLLTSQFLNEIKEKTGQIEELTAFTKGSIRDVDEEIMRLKNQITIAQEAMSKPIQKYGQVSSEHVKNAKEKFSQLKSELHGLIYSMFPNTSALIIEFMGQLMAERLNPASSGYIQITAENYQIAELLKDTNIISTNPYNKMEVKLAY